MNPDLEVEPIVGLSLNQKKLHSEPHSHQRGQLYYCIAGTMRVYTEDKSWIVTPHKALWVPAETTHQSTSTYKVDMRVLYINTKVYKKFPSKASLIEISALLNQLIDCCANFKNGQKLSDEDQRLADVTVDKLIAANSSPLFLPLPTDNRALSVCKCLLIDILKFKDVDEVCKKSGLSRKTFSRCLKNELNMSFSQWRQHALIVNSIEKMHEGHSITRVAFDLGYSSASAYSYMFRRTMGVSPTEYINTTHLITN